MLSDSQIRDAVRWRGLSISGYDEQFVQPASYDVHLHPKLLMLNDGPPLDPKVDSFDQWDEIEIHVEQGWVLRPGEFVLGSTLERVDMGDELMGQLEGKSSLGRLGLTVHSTAGYLDPGFTGQLTLELTCVQPRGIVLYPGMPIGQIAFMRCAAVDKPYAGKYGGQLGPTTSRYHQNWDEEEQEWIG